MSEDEIIKGITNIIYTCNEIIEDTDWYNEEEIKSAEEQSKLTQGLLDSYQKKKKKEKNKELDSEIIRIRATLNEVTKDYVRKDKIKEKIESIENMFEVCDEEINYKLKIEDKAKIEVLKELLEEE